MESLPEDAKLRSHNKVLTRFGIAALLAIAVATAIVGYHRSASRQHDRGASPPESSINLQDQEDAYMRSLVVDAPEGVTIRVDGNPRSPHARDRWIAAGREWCRYRRDHPDDDSFFVQADIADTEGYSWLEAGEIGRAATAVMCPEFRSR